MIANLQVSVCWFMLAVVVVVYAVHEAGIPLTYKESLLFMKENLVGMKRYYQE